MQDWRFFNRRTGPLWSQWKSFSGLSSIDLCCRLWRHQSVKKHWPSFQQGSIMKSACRGEFCELFIGGYTICLVRSVGSLTECSDLSTLGGASGVPTRNPAECWLRSITLSLFNNDAHNCSPGYLARTRFRANQKTCFQQTLTWRFWNTDFCICSVWSDPTQHTLCGFPGNKVSSLRSPRKNFMEPRTWNCQAAIWGSRQDCLFSYGSEKEVIECGLAKKILTVFIVPLKFEAKLLTPPKWGAALRAILITLWWEF